MWKGFVGRICGGCSAFLGSDIGILDGFCLLGGLSVSVSELLGSVDAGS